MVGAEEVLQVARCFLGQPLGDGEEEVLSILCQAALDRWRARLTGEEADCRGPLMVASAWTALGAMTGALEGSRPTPVSFTAGDLSVRQGEGVRGDALARSMARQAEGLMAPYVGDEAFAFLEVRG